MWILWRCHNIQTISKNFKADFGLPFFCLRIAEMTCAHRSFFSKNWVGLLHQEIGIKNKKSDIVIHYSILAIR